MKGKFQSQLERLVLHKIILLIGAGIVLFLLGLIVINFYSGKHNTSKNMDILVSSFEEQCRFGRTLLLDAQIQDIGKKMIKGEASADNLLRLLNRHSFEKGSESRVLLTDSQGKLYYSGFHEEEMTNYLLNYDGAVSYHAGKKEGESIYISFCFFFFQNSIRGTMKKANETNSGGKDE